MLLGRGLSRPLAAITAVMNRLSGGEIDVTIPGSERRDELGTMASAVDVFRRSMIEARSMREAQEASKQQTELEKKALQRQMADRFEADVKSVVAAVAQATTDMQRVAGEITTSVNGTSQRAAAAAAASDEASGQRQHGRRRDRRTGVLGGRDRPPGHPFQPGRRQRRGQGRTDHRDGRAAWPRPPKRSATCFA